MKISELIVESSAVNDLKKDLVNAKKQGKKLDYDGVGKIMKVVWNNHNMTGDELHDVFVGEIGCTPDAWIKKQEQVSEIQRTPSEGPPNSAARPTQIRMPNGVKRIPGAQNLGYLFTGGKDQVISVFTGANYLVSLYDLKRSAEIGWLALRSMRFPFPKSMQVANAKIHDEYRGRGMGQSLYGVAIKILGITIVADDTQTPEARRLWANLHGVPGVSVRGWISFPAQEVMPEFNDFDMFDTEQNLRKIAQLQRLPRGQQPQPLVEPKDSYDDAYFDFPVVSGPDGQELKAARNIAAIYSRTHPEDNLLEYQIGLFARWSG